MGTLGTLYIVCGILYTIACVMDGQDMKPLWKKWLGCKLEKMANYYHPINYGRNTEVVPFMPYVEVTSCDIKKLEDNFVLSEFDLFNAYRLEEKASEGRLCMRHTMTVDGIVSRVKEKCVQSVLERAKSFISIEEDRESRYPNIVVRARLYVGNKEQNYG